MKIFIDIDTGTWGDARYIRILDTSEAEILEMDQMPDSEIIKIGRDKGTPVQ
jgi:hypothetical protein